MSITWKSVEKHLIEHRRDLGWKGAPCVRLALKSGEKFFIFRTLESTEEFFAALVYVNEETIDETPRFHYMAIDPEQIAFMEAFEPENRRPEQLKRFMFVTTSAKDRERTDRLDKKDVSSK
jgi:hypothetical protein